MKVWSAIITGMKRNNLAIICTSDSEYLPYTIGLLKSIYTNSPILTTYIRLINCNNQQVKNIKNIHDNIHVITDTVHASSQRINKHRHQDMLLSEYLHHGYKKSYTKRRGSRWLYSDKMAYCSNIKFNTINTILNKTDFNLFYMDVDAVVRRDLSSLNNIINSYDVIFKITEATEHGLPFLDGKQRVYHGGHFGINNNTLTKQIFADMEEHVSNNMYYWDADECAIYDALTECSDVNICKLPYTYKDCGTYSELHTEHIFDDQSYIWSGAAQAKYINKSFVNEVRKYNHDI